MPFISRILEASCLAFELIYTQRFVTSLKRIIPWRKINHIWRSQVNQWFTSACSKVLLGEKGHREFRGKAWSSGLGFRGVEKSGASDVQSGIYWLAPEEHLTHWLQSKSLGTWKNITLIQLIHWLIWLYMYIYTYFCLRDHMIHTNNKLT